jgi:hypothetical protein
MTFTHPSSVSIEHGTMDQTVTSYCKLLSLPVMAQTRRSL